MKNLVSQTNVESLLQLGRNGMLTARAVVPGTGPVSWEMTGKICYKKATGNHSDDPAEVLRTKHQLGVLRHTKLKHRKYT